MGRYLVVDGIENNSKCISYPMIDLIRNVLSNDKKLFGEDCFVLSQMEVADILYSANNLIGNDDLLKKYIEHNKESYHMNAPFEEIKDVFTSIHYTFSKVLAGMVFYEKKNIICEWE